ncbi:MAG: tetratricopeptide repeat protein [Lewinella sp.]
MKANLIRLFCLQCLLFFNSGFCLGQNSEVDSLLIVCNNEQFSDTARLQALIALGASNYTREFPDSLLFYYKKAEGLVQKKGTPNDKVFYAYYQGIGHYRATRFLDAIEHLQQAKALAEAEKDTVQAIKSLNYLGNSYSALSDFSKSLEMATEGLLLSEALGEPRFITGFQANIGLIYTNYERYDEGREYMNNVLEYDRAQGNVVGELRGLTNLGATYGNEGNYEESRAHHLRAYAVVKENALWENAGTVLLNIGDCNLSLGDTAQAKYYILYGLKMAEREGETLAIARGTTQLAYLYRSSNPDSALYFAEKGLNLAREIGDLMMEESSLNVLYQLHENKGDYKKALALHKLWKQRIDTIFSEKNERAVYEIEARYFYEKQKLQDQNAFDQEMAKQELESQARFYLLLGALALLIVASVVVFQVRQNRSEKEKTTLLHEMELIKERVAVQSVSVEGVRQELQLARDKIEASIGKPLGDSSWNILNAIFENPSISNRDIAEKVFLSVEGVSSSLRRMYRSFGVSSNNSKNLKVALIARVVKISLGE